MKLGVGGGGGWKAGGVLSRATYLVRAPVPDGGDGQTEHNAGPGQGAVVVRPHQVHGVLGRDATLPVGVAGVAVVL